ncbi:MAG TPA: tRNA guanosine(34) transglycosylase Tgt [Acidimicrobiales bacterium]|nr:tRNA guanosine(34) transglycosylase Tgt [Acidimicrobiales bacterium]
MSTAAGHRARIEITAKDSAARTGTIRTARGAYAVPAFMPVGTRGAVKALDSADLEQLGAEVVLANTYHLMLRPGADVVAALGGLHRFTGWPGHTLTDSGGYQVHSLRPDVDDDGVTFASVYDGSRVRLTPESAVEAQGLIGADIQMVLDVCASHPAPVDVLRVAVDRTATWAARARRHHDRVEAKPEGQALFGIVQGGTDAGLRTESAERTVALGFDGYAIGGLSVGESTAAMLDALAVTVARLPEDRPRYLMGVGDPVGLIEAVALGVDQFDCVGPTRMARHGSILTASGRINLRNAVHADDDAPLDAACGCHTCSRWSRGYLRHLLGVGEPTAWRLLSVHNLAFVLGLMDEARVAIAAGHLDALRSAVGQVWGR